MATFKYMPDVGVVPVTASPSMSYINVAYGHLIQQGKSFTVTEFTTDGMIYHDIAERVRVPLDLNTFVIERGAHADGGNVGCVMEFASAMAGEDWTDHPKCVSTVIAAFLRNVNDNIDQEARQGLRPYVFRALDTRGSLDDERARAWMALDFVARMVLPAYLDVVGVQGPHSWLVVAKALRALPPVTSLTDLANAAWMLGGSTVGRWNRAEGLIHGGRLVPIPTSGPSAMFPPAATARAKAVLSAALNVGALVTGDSSIYQYRPNEDRTLLSCVVHDVMTAAHVVEPMMAAMVAKAVYGRALEMLNAMCAIGRTPVIEAKVRAVAEAKGKSAWLDEGVRDETRVLAGAGVGAGAGA